MSAREHLGLRAGAVLLVIVAALWPRSRPSHDAHVVAAHAVRGFTTAAARPAEGDLRRARVVRVLATDAEDSRLTN